MTRKNLSWTLISAIFLLFWTFGCQEKSASSSASAPSDDRRTRLIAQENLQLKQQIEDLNREIDAQKQKVQDCRQEMDNQIEQMKLTQANSVVLLGDITTELQKIKEENRQLKEELEKLRKAQ